MVLIHLPLRKEVLFAELLCFRFLRFFYAGPKLFSKHFSERGCLTYAVNYYLKYCREDLFERSKRIITKEKHVIQQCFN